MTNDRAVIDDFLAQKRIAFVGLSTDEASFSRAVLKELLARDYEVVPVHREAAAVAGLLAYPTVSDIEPPVDAALVMTPPSASADVVRDCAAAGVRRVWLHRGGGPGAVSEEAVAAAEEAGLALVAGECPMMFLAQPTFVHRVHAFGKKLLGRYPERAA